MFGDNLLGFSVGYKTDKKRPKQNYGTRARVSGQPRGVTSWASLESDDRLPGGSAHRCCESRQKKQLDALTLAQTGYMLILLFLIRVDVADMFNNLQRYRFFVDILTVNSIGQV